MTTTITTIVQETQVDGVGSIVVTDIVQDQTTSQYVREIRLFDGTGGSGNLIFTLRMTAPTNVPLEINVPPSLF
jgi:hypothetical protein